MTVGQAGLLERGGELARLEELAWATGDGRGAIALIEGAAGVGKTSLLDAASEQAKRAGFEVSSARAGLLETDLAWNVVRHLFSSVITGGRDRREPLLEGVNALARPALGIAHGAEAVTEEGAFHGLYWLTEALATEKPLLLAVDDLHWADRPSLRYISYLGERIEDLPVLLLVVTRSGEGRGAELHALRSLAARNTIVLSELSPSASAALARAELEVGAADEFCAACYTATGGNPFLLHELVLQLRADGTEPTAANAPGVARVTPHAVNRNVLLRFSLLPDAERELAIAAAVAATEMSLAEAAAIARLEPAVASVAADALAAAGILSPGSPLRFAHPLIREVVYGSLAAHERAQRHRDAGAKLAELGAEPRRVAVQLVGAEPAGDQWVVDELRAAATANLAEGAPQPAVDFLSRALQEPPSSSLRPTLLHELATAEAFGGSELAMQHLELALTEGEDEAVAADLVLIRFRHGLMAEAIAMARELLDRGAIKDPVRRARVIASAVTAAILLDDPRPQLDYFLTQIPDGQPDDSPAGRLLLCARLAYACAQQHAMSEIGDLAERALGGGELLRELSSHELLYWNATSSLIVADRFDAAHAAIRTALDEARRRGSVVGFALASCFGCKLSQRIGDIASGVGDGWQAMNAAPEDIPLIRAYAAAFLAECLIDRGEAGQAVELLTRPEFTGETPRVFGYQLMRASRGQASIAAGEVEAGVEELLALGAELGDAEFGPAMLPWRSRAAVGLAQLGQLGEAGQLAGYELEMAERSRSGWGRAIALQALAAAAPRSAPELLQDAICVSKEHGFRLERARSLVLLGAHERRRGQRRRAAELLEEGLAEAVACGAPGLEQRVRSEMLAIGLTPRRRGKGRSAELTPAERRVAELALEGKSNREIAQALFVSLRTVETHLTHSYRKLDIDSRAQLGPALAIDSHEKSW